MLILIKDFDKAPEDTVKVVTHKLLGDMYENGKDEVFISGEWMSVAHMVDTLSVKMVRGRKTPNAAG